MEPENKPTSARPCCSAKPRTNRGVMMIWFGFSIAQVSGWFLSIFLDFAAVLLIICWKSITYCFHSEVKDVDLPAEWVEETPRRTPGSQ